MNKILITPRLGEKTKTNSEIRQDDHQPVHWDVLVDGQFLASTEQTDMALPCLDAYSLILSRHNEGEFYVLNCACGVAECLGLDEGIHVRKAGASVRWTFPKQYFAFLQHRGLVDGELNEVSFTFDEKAFDEQLNLAYRAALEAETPAKPATLGAPEMFSGGPLKDQLKRCSTRAAERQRLTMEAVGSRPDMKPYPLIRPKSFEGSRPDFDAALPRLPSYERGRRFAVGSPRLHLVYQYRYDDQAKRGSWAYLYTESNGRALPRIAAHNRPDGWRYHSAPHQPVCDWGPDCYVQWGAKGLVLRSGGGSYTTAFFEAFPEYPDTYIRGEGPSIEEAERAAFAKLLRYRNCLRHEFERRSHTNGAGFCKHCGLFKSKALPPTTLCTVCQAPTDYCHAYDEEGTGYWYCETHESARPKDKHQTVDEAIDAGMTYSEWMDRRHRVSATA